MRMHYLPWILGLLGTASPAFAHGMTIRAETTATELRVEVRYRKPDNKTDRENEGGGEVTLKRVDSSEIVAKLPLDANGDCTFPKPPSGRYRLAAKDKYGHGEVLEIDVFEGSKSESAASLPPIIGLVLIAVLTLAAWFWLGRRKPAAT